MNHDKFIKYLTLFGLRENFTLDELTGSFRTLAKLNHPDVSSDKDSDRSMAVVNEGYQFLKNNFANGEIKEYLAYREPGKREEKKSRVEDIFYDQYKKGFIILKTAFDDYYGDTEDKSGVGNMEELKKELLRAKIEFAVLINDLPYNVWVSDAIDKINSINKWLD